MLITRHQGLQIFERNSSEDTPTRSKNIYQVNLEKEHIPSSLRILEFERYTGDPTNLNDDKTTKSYGIEIKKEDIALKFEDLKIAKIYFDILLNFRVNDTLEYMTSKHSEYFI